MTQLKFPPDIWIFALPLLCALQVALFGYHTTMAEPDMVRMMAGMVYGGSTGLHLQAGYHYGSAFSFGFYQLLYFLLPASTLNSPDQTAAAINFLGWVTAFLFALNLCLMLSRFTTRNIALFCSAAYLFCPLTLPFLASAHPMIGACAFLFLACWLLLRATENRTAPRFALHLALVFAALLLSMTLRGEIALALPFVGLCFWIKLPGPWRQRWLPALLAGMVMALAFAAFLVLQKPYVELDGGAAKSLSGYMSIFLSFKHIVRGLGIVVLAMGSVTTLWLAVALFYWIRSSKTKAVSSSNPSSNPSSVPPSGLPQNWPLVLTALVLVLPVLLFWLPKPLPARHFILPILGLYLLLGQWWSGKLLNQKQALVLAAVLIAGNQAAAELTRPWIINAYEWAYSANGIRRATQQAPLGLFPLDQRANMASEAVLKQEAIRLTARNPSKLLILADAEFYLIAHLVAQDPALRLTQTKVGPANAWLLSRPSGQPARQLYLIEKNSFWPGDILSVIQTLPEFADYPLYVQKATISRYDKTSPAPARSYVLE